MASSGARGAPARPRDRRSPSGRNGLCVLGVKVFVHLIFTGRFLSESKPDARRGDEFNRPSPNGMAAAELIRRAGLRVTDRGVAVVEALRVARTRAWTPSSRSSPCLCRRRACSRSRTPSATPWTRVGSSHRARWRPGLVELRVDDNHHRATRTECESGR